jgi:tetratricopeptide (TPR) repeat protein
MRFVLTPLDPIYAAHIQKAFPERDNDLLCIPDSFGTYAEFCSQFPKGWTPDAIIHWGLEYYPVPEGLEEAECFTVGMVGDWNLGGQAFRLMGDAFDLLIADRNGCERLWRAGFRNVAYAPLWFFNPALHRRLPEVVRDLDIVMVGNFNHDVQRERAKWLARVARLSKRYRVLLTTNVYGEEYVHLMNRAKIVFNRSIRGEINMRVYEAAACGALLFYERENAEIEELFKDRHECVLYGEEDLEDLLEYYLSHPTEARQIAEAGWRKVQTHSGTHQIARILNLVESAWNTHIPSERPFYSLPPAEKDFRRACHLLLLPDNRILPRAEQLLLRAEAQAPTRADIANARGCLAARWADTLQDPVAIGSVRALGAQLFERALQLQPDYAAARLNLSKLYLALSLLAPAQEELTKVLHFLRATEVHPEQLRGPYYPNRFDAFKVEIEDKMGASTPGSPEWRESMRVLLLWNALETASDLAFATARYAEAASLAQEAVALKPEQGTTRHRLAKALRALGETTQAEEAYRQALREYPLSPEMWLELAELLCETEQTEKCTAFIEDIYTILDGCPVYEWVRPKLSAIARKAQATPSSSHRLHLLAFPNWNDPKDWQPMLERYVQSYTPAERVTFTLLVDPTQHPPVETLVENIESYLRQYQHLASDAMPDVVLLHQRLSEEELDSLFRQVDVLIARGNSPQEMRAKAVGLPVLSVEHMGAARHTRLQRRVA